MSLSPRLEGHGKVSEMENETGYVHIKFPGIGEAHLVLSEETIDIIEQILMEARSRMVKREAEKARKLEQHLLNENLAIISGWS